MTERDDCINRIVRASGDKFTRKQAADALDEILSRAERQGPAWQAIDEKLAQAARDLEDQLLERATIAKRNERLDAMKAIARHKYYERAPSAALGMEAKLGGINTPFAGGRLSVDSQYKGLRREILGGFWLALEKGGVEKLFLDGSLERDWARELHEINKGSAGAPGITRDENALKIAEAVHAFQKVAVDRINAEGGWIKNLFGYITRTTHDPDRIRRSGREQWIEDVMAHLDVRRTFHDDDPNQARKLLADLWPQFVTGDHFDYSKPLDDISSIIDIDVARKASAPRELHWKDADAWLAYNQKYGRFPPTYAVIHSFDNAAKITALMKEFGAHPRKALEEDFHYLKARLANNPEARIELDKREAMIRDLFAQFDGTAQRPINRTMAQIGSGVRSVVRMSKLGLTPYAMLSDLATKTSELRYQGMTVPERFGTTISDYFRGWGFIRGDGADSTKRQMANLMLHAFDAEIGMLASRFDSEAVAMNAIARAEQRFFRWTGINSMTWNQRHGAERVMAAHFGMMRGKAFADLGEAETRILNSFEIGRNEWDALNKVAWNELEGQTYLTPDVAKRLSDDAVRDLLVANGKLHRDATGDFVATMIGRERDNLALKLAAYFADRGEMAVLEPGARERALLYGGMARDWAPGTLKGEAWRMFLQFKQFPATMLMRTWGRELYGGQGTVDKVAGLAEFIVYSTMLGIVANGLNQITKGQDPTSKWEKEPIKAVLSGFVRGGAASIYGDYLLGEWSRHGIPLSASILGPTLGQVDKVAELWSDLTHMKARTATGMLAGRMVRENLPFANMIYTKMAVDYLVYHEFQEWLNPGYLARHERVMRDKQKIEYWLRPTQVQSQGLFPAIGAALGGR